MALVLQAGPAADPRGQLNDELLREVHEVEVGGVRLVELEHRELGVVFARQPLVAEVTVDLVDALDPADDQTLQVEFRRDPQVEVEPERVVVRAKGLGQRAAQDRVHHRRLDLDEVARVEEVAHAAHDASPLAKGPRHRLVDDEIDVALAVAGLDVGQPMPLLGQRAHRLGQQAQRPREQRRLACPRAEARPVSTDHVADVQQRDDLPRALVEHVPLEVELQPSRAIRDFYELRLSERAPRDDATHHGEALRRRL